ncbi:hypothetical protein M6D93_19010 [Jatrophihabitans telluris]|uniref:Antibiotic biosynthesis monooxygenase n=1 Tax=Jatrophihabitans telluris TaxID=2038343 RepID=A0ABY4QY61_9ACTN|nr:hypothetical protein [Jatrophihabitans telluris]UQX88349.1 hypothetical protein M6D93_19010 [Jatrophihabitans telluris]
MSVLIIGKIHGDTTKFQQALHDRGDEFARIAEQARPEGALHHRFGVGDGMVMIVDEWASAEQFEKFFGAPDLQSFIASVGGDTSIPPDFMITEAISSPDQF